MKTSVVVHSAALTPGNNAKALREGSSVYVRVLKNNGNGSYKVSFAGGSFDIRSSVPLEVGSSFKAGISLAGSRVILKMQGADILLDSSKLYKLPVIFDSEGRITNPKIIQYFANLGLYPDELSYELFNLTKDTGSRFDREIISKARILGMKFKGREKKAASAAFILMQKGIVPDSEMVEALMEDEGENLSLDSEKAGDGKAASNSFADFFEEIFCCRGTENYKSGLLTLFNHLGFKKETASFGNWIKVPFDFKYFREGRKNGKGSFYAFLDAEKKSPRRIVLNFDFSGVSYGFCIFMNGGQVQKILAAADSPDLSSVESRLKVSFPEVEVTEVSYGDFHSFMPENEGLSMLEGVV